MELPYRPRRLRRREPLRRLVRETHLRPDDFIYPLFVAPGKNIKEPIAAMPGIHRWSVDLVAEEVKAARDTGVPAVLLFGLPEHKDDLGSEAGKRTGVVQRAIKQIKKAVPDILVITDVCLCGYTSHGHCGVVHDGEVDNDAHPGTSGPGGPLPCRGRGGYRGALGYDGRPGPGHPGSPGRTGF